MFLLSDARHPTHEGIRINELPRGPGGSTRRWIFPLGTRPVRFIGFQFNAPLFPEDFYSPTILSCSLSLSLSRSLSILYHTRVLRISLYYQVIPTFSIGRGRCGGIDHNRVTRATRPFEQLFYADRSHWLFILAPSRSPEQREIAVLRKREETRRDETRRCETRSARSK